MKTCVVKLGGSLSFSKALPLWLMTLTEAAQQQCIVIVPGGGAFADTVRETQVQIGFSDNAAHHMAILAMAQWGLVLHDKLPNSQLFYLDQVIPAIPGLHIWIPDRAVLNASELEHSWRITSDSLAGWLAQQLAADTLHIIKSAAITTADTAQLIASGILDDSFEAFTSPQIPIQLFSHQQAQNYPESGVFLK